jgi:hypothetical protein
VKSGPALTWCGPITSERFRDFAAQYGLSGGASKSRAGLAGLQTRLRPEIPKIIKLFRRAIFFYLKK